MTPSQTDPPRPLVILLVVGSAIGLLAAATLLVEKINVLVDPNYVPSCSLNPILSCGSVLNTPQAAAFGFPNPIMGIAGFAITLTIGVAILAGAQFRRWFWLGLLAGATLGAVFVHWLIFQSLYRIGALCPYCMVVWSVTIPIFWYVALHTIKAGHLPLPAGLRRVGEVLRDYHAVILTSWFLGVLALITIRFWTYWETLLS